MNTTLSGRWLGLRATERRGYATLMALVFLVIGTALGTGLYAMVTSATAITANEQRAARALGAAETGMEFMRHQLTSAATTTAFAGVDGSQWVGPLADSLGQAMNGTTTLGGKSLAAPVAFTLTIPSIALDDGSSFTALVEPTSDNRRISLIVTGYSTGGVSRRLEVDFSGPPVVFPLAARGGIPSATNVNATGLKGLSYTPTTVNLTSGGTGAVLLYPGMTAPTSTLYFPNNDALIQTVAGLGLKPITDSSTRTVTPVIAQNSCSVPPNTNPTLSGTLNGIIYVQWPNAVTIGDSLILNGTIVFERKNGKAGTSTLDAPRGTIIDRSMDAASAAIQQSTFSGVDQLKWWSIIAPDVDLTMHNGTTWGTVKTFEGSLQLNCFNREGGGNQVAFNITKGGIVAEGTINMSSGGAEYLINPDTKGVGGRLLLVATSYQELLH